MIARLSGVVGPLRSMVFALTTFGACQVGGGGSGGMGETEQPTPPAKLDLSSLVCRKSTTTQTLSSNMARVETNCAGDEATFFGGCTVQQGGNAWMGPYVMLGQGVELNGRLTGGFAYCAINAYDINGQRTQVSLSVTANCCK